jgi:hypothetical protein
MRSKALLHLAEVLQLLAGRSGLEPLAELIGDVAGMAEALERWPS